MVDISFTPSGFDEAANTVQSLKDFVNIKTEQQFLMLLDQIVADARSNLQNNLSIVSGDLNASVRVIKQEGMTGLVGTESPYAGFVEFGRGPVRPIKAKVLHWKDPDTGEDVFAKYAKAAEPKPFMEPAVISNTQQFPNVMAVLWNKAIE